MSTMSAALHNGKGAMEIKQIEKPEPGPDDAVVRVRQAGICGSDLLNYALRTDPEEFPGGHEVTGEIVEVGEDVDAGRVGERVAIDTLCHGVACGVCWYCRTGQTFHCRNRDPVRGGGFAEYIQRRAVGCFPLSDGMSWAEGALVEPLAVSVHAMRKGQLSGGEVVAVVGSGTIGLTAVAAARAMGAGVIFASARHEHQAALARQLGADHALPSEGSALQEAVAEATDGRGADLTIETIGGHSAATVQQAVEVTRRQGRVVVLGNIHVSVELDWMTLLGSEKSLVMAACYGVIDGRHDYEIAIDLMAGRVDLRDMVTHTFPLEDIQPGFDAAYDKTTGSVKVHITQMD